MPRIKLPGLIDVHVHLRDPGQTNKEDFFTGTKAALYGGFTTVLDMPNNATPITTAERLQEKIREAQKKAVCDIGFYFGSLGNNFNELALVQNKVFGLKLYLNETTGNYMIGEMEMIRIYNAWNGTSPILLHAEEGETLEKALNIVKKVHKKTHICHVSSQTELRMILKAKEDGLPITCGVTPHHLFLTEKDEKKLGSFGLVKPTLKKQSDVDFLWDHIGSIDVIESDHAPHTIQEKKSDHPPFGLTGLETTLYLLLSVIGNKLTIDDIVRLCFKNPKKIFRVPTDSNTYIEIDSESVHIVNEASLHTKSGWSPFSGWKLKGNLVKVVIRGVTVVNEDHALLVNRGFGKVICSSN